jgi:hypothetical protein
MRKIWVLAIGLNLLFSGFLLPGSAQAQFKFSYKSIHCDVTLATGGNPATDDYVTCAVNIKEITGVCKNPADGSAVLSNGQPFKLQAFVQAASTGSWTKTANGQAQQDIVISNQMIQEAFDIYNAQNGLPFVFLQTTSALCKKGWISHGWFVTKVDATLADSKVPSVQDANRNVVATGSVSYFNKTAAPTVVSIPQWNWTWDNPDNDPNTPDGENGSLTDPSQGIWNGTSFTQVYVFPFNGEPFKYCSRFTEAAVSPSGTLADSGLRIYDTSEGLVTGTPYGQVAVNDKTYKVKNCYLWRDVNKDPAFDLSAFGIYDPDVANIIPPQTGNPQQKVKGQLVSVPDDKLGGFVLRSVSADPTVVNYYTGECHQHGKETNGGGNYAWNQQGPAKTEINPDGTLNIRDPICQGGSQLMDGTYDDGILP